MVDQEYQVDKLHPFKTKPNETAFIKDADLQVNVSHARDTFPLDESSVNFKEIYTHYKNEAIQGASAEKALAADDVRHMMEDAKNTFDSMMQIREQLNQAYKELTQLQS